MFEEDTIAAIATPYGEGGVGMIRISGPRASEILEKIFLPAAAAPRENRKMTFGKIVDHREDKVIDEVLCVFMKGPKTYTTEDTAEIYCHGGMMPLKQTLDLCMKEGARAAEPGEFTKRAFLGGRIDLSQAEAVMDIVAAKTEKSHAVAMDQLAGSLSERIRKIRASLTDILVDLTVNIDYPDEDIEEVTYDGLGAALSSVRRETKELLDNADSGRMLREGLKIALAGKPNVGKSSVMNALLKQSRAIVTDIPGTTRDTIEEKLDVRGIPVVLTDTAGIRDSSDEIEAIGIHRTKEALEGSDVIFMVVDGSMPLGQQDRDIAAGVAESEVLCLVNKGDLPQRMDKSELDVLLPTAKIVEISAMQSTGLDEVENYIEELVFKGQTFRRENVMITNARHKSLMERADVCILDSMRAVEDRAPLELIEIDVNEAYGALGQIIGEETAGDVLEEVFARFCLGK